MMLTYMLKNYYHLTYVVLFIELQTYVCSGFSF